MARWRKVDLRVWADARFRSLSIPAPNARDIFLGLMIGPCTTAIPGVVIGTQEQIAASLGWGGEGFREAFQEAFFEVLQKMPVKADLNEGLVWLVNATKYNQPQSSNVVISWREVWDVVPECPLKSEMWHALKAFTEGMGEGYVKAFLKGLKEPRVDLSTGFFESFRDPGAGAGARARAREEETLSASGEAADLDSNSEPAPSKPKKTKATKPAPEPLPFKVEEALAEIAKGGGFVASKPNKGQAILCVKLIRAYPDLETWRLIGEWLPKGREAWRVPLDTRNLADFEAWVAHAKVWLEAGRPEAKRGPAPDIRRGQMPIPEGF